MSTVEKKIDERLADGSARLSRAIDDFQSNATESRSQASSLLSEITSERTAEIERTRRELKEALSSICDEGQEYMAKIRTIYGIVGGDASAGQLVHSANGEAKAYRLLGAAAFLAFIFGSYFAYTAVQPALVPGVDLHMLLGRAGLVLASYIPAWFLASLAMKHRRAELSFRSLAVRVAAFDPYLSEFGMDTRVELKRQMAELFFSSELHVERSTNFRIRDLKDFERLAAPIESIVEKFRAISTGTK